VKTRKTRLHQLEIRVIENGFVRKHDSDGRHHVNSSPYQEFPAGTCGHRGRRRRGLLILVAWFRVFAEIAIGLLLGFDIEERDARFAVFGF
jgi:hypothetical protein